MHMHTLSAEHLLLVPGAHTPFQIGIKNSDNVRGIAPKKYSNRERESMLNECWKDQSEMWLPIVSLVREVSISTALSDIKNHY